MSVNPSVNGAETITAADVRAARETIGGDLHRTPVFSSRTLGPSMYLKAELFQRTGSFKPRGVLTKLRSLSDDERERGVIGVSAGNHAQALAWCARHEGLDALLVMWRTASPAKVAATEAYGAEVDLSAEGPETVFDRLEEMIAETGRTLVHPFDDPLVVAGQGTVGLEIAEDVPDVDTVVVPVGGGGLVAGIAAALPQARIVGVEPSASNALTVGLAADQPIPVSPRSVADGLNAPFAGELAIRVAREHGVHVVLVDDDEIEDAMRFLYERAKLACEPAGAAGVAAIRSGRIPLDEAENVAIVVSGGNVSAQTAAAILARP